MGKFGTPEGMTYPTAEDYQSWPQPNYIDPVSRKPVVIGVEVSITVLAACTVLARFYTRSLIKHALGWDDWLMLAAMVCSISVTILHCLATQYALGLHLWDVKHEWGRITGILTYVSITLFAPTASLGKISISLTQMRILPSSTDRMFARCAIVFSILYCLSITAVQVFQCWPIRAYWAWKIDHYQCIKERPFNYSAQALNSVSDFLIFLWPARTLWSVRVPIKQRLLLIFVFSVGAIVCLVGILRIYFLYRYFHSYDVYWTGAITSILTQLEANGAIICGCLPGIKPLLTRLFPNTFGSSVDRTHTTFDFSHRRLPGARLSLREPRHILSHRPSEASMVEVPIKLDEGWGGVDFPPLAVVKSDEGRLLPQWYKAEEPHPGRRLSEA